MTFPDVSLSTPYVGQTTYQSSTVKVLQIDDNVSAKHLCAFCQLGDDASFKYWVTVLSGNNYTVDWTNAQVAAAITAYFVNA